jgi:hypothetical protein
MNFNDCINNYRIEAVKNSFSNGEHKKSTLELRLIAEIQGNLQPCFQEKYW